MEVTGNLFVLIITYTVEPLSVLQVNLTKTRINPGEQCEDTQFSEYNNTTLKLGYAILEAFMIFFFIYVEIKINKSNILTQT